MTGLLRVEHASQAGRLTLDDVQPGARLVWLRAAILGGSAAGVGTLSHVAGDGMLPGFVAMTVLFAAAISIAGILVLTRASRLRIVVALVGGQALMHMVLASLAGHRGAPTGQGDGFLSHQLDHLTAAGPTMVLTHIAGALLLGVFLALGEERLFRHLTEGVLADYFFGLLAARAVGIAASTVPAVHQVLSTERGRWARTPTQKRPRLVRRGPPVLRTTSH